MSKTNTYAYRWGAKAFCGLQNSLDSTHTDAGQTQKLYVCSIYRKTIERNSKDLHTTVKLSYNKHLYSNWVPYLF